jgi:prepilin-type N-terminal cleavage/methylation domain-containing protein
MSMLASHLGRMREDERGMTLPELLVAMSIFSVISIIVLNTLVSVQRSVVRATEWQQNNDQARLAIETIDRQIRSGGLLYSPGSVSGNAGAELIVYTQSSAPAFKDPTYPASGYSGNRCVEWRVSGGNLQTRWWRSQYLSDGSVGTLNTTTWRIVATGVVNYTSPNNLAVFSLDSDPLKGGRTINVALLVNTAFSVRPNETVKIQAALTARNTASGLSTACPSQPG